jgi:hypothetical protein
MNESRWSLGLCVIAALVLLHSGATPAQSETRSAKAIEVVSVKSGGIDLRIHNIWKSPVSVGMCDEPQRLSGVAFELQRLTGSKWSIIRPAEVVLGDLPPKFVQIDVGKSLMVPVRFSPTFVGIVKGEKIRVVVTVWHTETSLMTGAPSTDSQAPSFRISSEPIEFVPAKSRR